MYEKQVVHQIKSEHDTIQPTLIPTQQPASQPNNNLQQQQQHIDVASQQLPQQSITKETNDQSPSPIKDTSSETIDVTTVVASVASSVAQQQQQQQQHQEPMQLQQPSQQQQHNGLDIVLNGNHNTLKASPENVVPTDPTNVPQHQQHQQQQEQHQQQQMVYNREIPPPNSIYGIDSLTSKPYDVDGSMQSPRFNQQQQHQQQHNPYNPIPSPHQQSSSPDRNGHRLDSTNWLSPGKNLPFRGLCPPTSPYVDNRDANLVAAAAAAAGTQAARRFMPPFYGGAGTAPVTGTGRNFVHPTATNSATNDRNNRYGNYSVGSPMISTLGYPRDPTMDARYNLHIPPALGFGEDDKFKLSPPSVEDKHIWTKQEIELLLDLYEEYKSKLQDPRVRKTKVWDDIARQIHDKLEADVNGCQCNQKFRNMKADYQKVVEHNARAGSFRKTCKYYDRLEKLLTPVSETERFKTDELNGAYAVNGFGSKAGTPNSGGSAPGNGFYDSSRSSTTSSDDGKATHPSSAATSSGGTPSSPVKRGIDQVETTSDDPTPPPSKRPCGGGCQSSDTVSKKELVDVLKDFLKEQRKRDDDNFAKLQELHKEKLDAVVKFLDLFQDLVKKV